MDRHDRKLLRGQDPCNLLELFARCICRSRFASTFEHPRCSVEQFSVEQHDRCESTFGQYGVQCSDCTQLRIQSAFDLLAPSVSKIGAGKRSHYFCERCDPTCRMAFPPFRESEGSSMTLNRPQRGSEIPRQRIKLEITTKYFQFVASDVNVRRQSDFCLFSSSCQCRISQGHGRFSFMALHKSATLAAAAIWRSKTAAKRGSSASRSRSRSTSRYTTTLSCGPSTQGSKEGHV